jgi:hypothetical protein
LTAAGGIKVTRSFQVTDPGVTYGDLRYYQGGIQGYDVASGTWRGVNTQTVTTHTQSWFGVGIGYNSATNPGTLTTLSLTDPGWPYMLEVSFTVVAANGNTSTRWDIFCRDTNTSGAEICALTLNQNNAGFATYTSYTSWYGPITGAKTIIIDAELISGAGNLLIDSTARGSNLHVNQVAVPPSQ